MNERATRTITQEEAAELLIKIYHPDMYLCLIYMSADCTQATLSSGHDFPDGLTETQVIAAACLKTYDPERDVLILPAATPTLAAAAFIEMSMMIQLMVFGHRRFDFLTFYIPYQG